MLPLYGVGFVCACVCVCVCVCVCMCETLITTFTLAEVALRTGTLVNVSCKDASENTGVRGRGKIQARVDHILPQPLP